MQILDYLKEVREGNKDNKLCNSVQPLKVFKKKQKRVAAEPATSQAKKVIISDDEEYGIGQTPAVEEQRIETELGDVRASRKNTEKMIAVEKLGPRRSARKVVTLKLD